jgi:hypothetical protein
MKVLEFPAMVDKFDAIANPKPGDTWESALYWRKVLGLLDEDLRPSNIEDAVWVKYQTAKSASRCKLDRWRAFCESAVMTERGKTEEEALAAAVAVTEQEKALGLLRWGCKMHKGMEYKLLRFTWGQAQISGPWRFLDGPEEGQKGWQIVLTVGGQGFTVRHIGYTGPHYLLSSPFKWWSTMKRSDERAPVVAWISVVAQALVLGARDGDSKEIDKAMGQTPEDSALPEPQLSEPIKLSDYLKPE